MSKATEARRIESISKIKPGKGDLQLTEKELNSDIKESLKNYKNLRSENVYPLKNGKVILVGESNVGKTSLFMRATTDSFFETYMPTVQSDFFNKKYVIYGTDYYLSIWDTAGQGRKKLKKLISLLERFQSLTKAYYRNVNACLILFDLTSQKSLQKVETWYEQAVNEIDEENFSLFLVGNKSDLERMVDEKEGLKVASQLEAEYWEVSSKEGVNTTELFDRIGFTLWNRNMKNWQIEHNEDIIEFKKTQEENSEMSEGGCCN
eukprot:gene4086-7375_t